MTSNRFGFDAPGNVPLEDSIRWAGEHGFHYIDFQADLSPNHLASFDEKRVRAIRALCKEHDVALGIHPSSAINSAEYVPIMAEAVESYLYANLETAHRLGCGWMVAHGGYHFGDLARRQEVSLSRLQGLAQRAEELGVAIYFENHNREPEHAEMHYLPHNVAETAWFFERVDAPNVHWAFNVAHGHLVPEGWEGFLDAFGVEQIGQVRVNDNRGDYEIHLVPGEGTIDFPTLFRRLRKAGYGGWFNLGFGDWDDKLRIRAWFETLL